jgi:hypothetical protein
MAGKSRKGKRRGVSAAGSEPTGLDFSGAGVIIHQFAWAIATPTPFPAFAKHL